MVRHIKTRFTVACFNCQEISMVEPTHNNPSAMEGTLWFVSRGWEIINDLPVCPDCLDTT